MVFSFVRTLSVKHLILSEKTFITLSKEDCLKVYQDMVKKL